MVWILAIVAGLIGADVQLSMAAESAEKTEIALSEVAPELYFQLRRYPKFYGDPNTAHGGLP